MFGVCLSEELGVECKWAVCLIRGEEVGLRSGGWCSERQLNRKHRTSSFRKGNPVSPETSYHPWLSAAGTYCSTPASLQIRPLGGKPRPAHPPPGHQGDPNKPRSKPPDTSPHDRGLGRIRDMLRTSDCYGE
ncbi:hypothetical protein DPEC_G00299180 [Dallia pectoralis]|uniref:Uncharacterized protein n=1 Tax=Dallia pectoralis TaxID=75939 RepID=A0ACC2FGF1_DALPE|nr:hypothetical protein DPEC_G00299180 [Dallia pectoralis]